MKSTILKSSFAALALCLFNVLPTAHAATVGWNFSHGSFGDENLLASESAGAPGFVQNNWNNHVSSGQGPGATPLSLFDDAGGATSVSITSWTQTADNSWHYNGHASSPDDRLTGGFANRDVSLEFSGINGFTDDGYTVVVYYGNNEFVHSSGASLTVNGQTQNIQTSDSNAAVGYILNTDDGATRSNYAVFSGIAGDVLDIVMDSTQNDGISAVQIVAAPVSTVPEPGTFGLLIAGCLGWLGVTRRRRPLRK